MDLASVFAEPLVDLGSKTPDFSGVYAPESTLGAAKIGVTSQFLENAEAYHRAYFDTGYWNFLLGNALSAARLDATPAADRIFCSRTSIRRDLSTRRHDSFATSSCSSS